MAHDGDVPADESLNCGTCVTPSHVTCISSPPPPDCSGDHPVSDAKADDSLTDTDENKKRKQSLSGDDDGEFASLDVDLLAAIFENLNCSICTQMLERPVKTPCEHNFCLKCFEKWIDRGNQTCAKCRSQIPDNMASNPRVNFSLVSVLRFAKVAKSAGTAKRAKKTGEANAPSGRIYVRVPSDYFGPIPAEYDPIKKQGILVGESWEDRVECRQRGAHLAHVSGIARQSDYGAQSVALSGGYKGDMDHGDWFLYTGSGEMSHSLGRNRRSNEDQKFENLNEALRLSCKFGYPVRVVRSCKQKRSAYAPEKGVRYDGVYRIEKCWRKAELQDSFKVCRYLFVRCDNEPAPWTSDDHGDRPRPLPHIPELDMATDLFERKITPSWDFDERWGLWRWMKAPVVSTRSLDHVMRRGEEEEEDESEED